MLAFLGTRVPPEPTHLSGSSEGDDSQKPSQGIVLLQGVDIEAK